MITIVGGTGRLGRLVAERLVGDGHPVRLVGRSFRGDLPQGAEFVAADVRRPETLPPAVAGSSVVVSAVHGLDPAGGESPAQVDRDGNLALIKASRAAGADIVLVSSIDASAEHPMELMRMKAAAERELQDNQPDQPDWTIVRPTAYVEMHAELLRQTARKRGIPRVFGRGENPINFVTVTDVATVVHRAVLDPGLRGEIIDVGGPDNLTMNELARIVTGQPKVSHVPPIALRTTSRLLAKALPAQARLARMALQMDTLPMGFDPGPGRAAHFWLPCTPITQVIHT